MKPMTIAFALGVAGVALTGALAASASVPLAAFSAVRSIDTERENADGENLLRTSSLSPITSYADQSR